eukprot:gb/GECH01009863.1/.p1 GENE.gb/GECH01009863.1/~~gb/GECH01009863.1/.p1  ORF type:complete len:874 (+),score=185.05 gb/GECH01009863.1/:1-2622(+)
MEPLATTTTQEKNKNNVTRDQKIPQNKIKHVSSIQLRRSSRFIDSGGDFVAVVMNENMVGLWKYGTYGREFKEKPKVILSCHEYQVTALAFGNQVGHLKLVTCSHDKIVLWNVTNLLSQESESGTIIGTEGGPVSCCCFDLYDNFLIVCIECTAFVFDIKKQKIIVRLEGHQGRITSVCFSNINRNWIFTVSEDGTFKLWDLKTHTLKYDSQIVSASPLKFVSSDPLHNRCAIGTEDGKILFFDLEDECFRKIYTLDVHKFMTTQMFQEIAEEKQKNENEEKEGDVIVISKTANQKKRQKKTSVEQVALEYNSAIINHSILFLRYETFYSRLQIEKKSIYTPPPVLIVGTNGGLSTINTSTYEMFTLAGSNKKDIFTSTASNFSICKGNETELRCFVTTAFDAKIHAYELELDHNIDNTEFETDQNVEETEETSTQITKGFDISIFATKEIPDRMTSPIVTPNSSSKDRHRSSVNRDKPVTFHNKVKSSGYGTQPAFHSRKKPKKQKSNTNFKIKNREYPIHCKLPSIYQKSNVPGASPKIHSSPIHRVLFSSDASKVATSSNDHTVRITKTPLSKFKGEGWSLVGHNGVVTDVNWNMNDHLLVTSSLDNSAFLWQLSRTDPLIKLSHINGNISNKAKEDNFTSEVRNAKFYYRDKLISLVCGRNIFLFKYLIDRKSEKDDILRKKNPHKYKLAARMISGGNTILSMDCINKFKSNIISTTSSNKSIEIFDVNTCSLLRQVENAHQRPAHTIQMNEGSSYITHSSNTYHLFLTASSDNSIKLWDLRAPHPVRSFTSHMNRVQKIGVAFSPCMRFIGCGSEDRCAYVYDINTGKVLHKYQGHSDVVSDVCFNPLHPQFATTSFDATVRFYSSKE